MAVKITLTKTDLPFINKGNVAGVVQKRFAQEAGQVIINAIRVHLGNDIYTLEPEYAKRKPFTVGFRRFPGKQSDQPLILSGVMYNSLEWRLEGNTLIVDVQDGRGVSKRGFDYAEWWEEITSYLELGFADVEDTMDEHLLDICFQEMAL